MRPEHVCCSFPVRESMTAAWENASAPYQGGWFSISDPGMIWWLAVPPSDPNRETKQSNVADWRIYALELQIKQAKSGVQCIWDRSANQTSTCVRICDYATSI